MEIEKLSPDLSVSAQVQARDLPQIHALGYRTVICNRPDGEAEDQPLYETIKTSAAASGLKTVYIPVPSTGVEDAQVAVFEKAWPDVEKPALLYCRSGGRSRTLAKRALGI